MMKVGEVFDEEIEDATENNEETGEKHEHIQYVSEATAVLSQVNTVSNEGSNRVATVEEQNNSRKIS